MIPRPLTAALALLAALDLAGCLEAGRGGTASDTVSTDTSACTTSASCGDGDPCTWDECVAETGSCAHWAAPMGAREAPFAECDSDAACADGDPCTFDRCELGADGCGYGATCVHEEADGCYGCQQTGCDDGNPCTVDICHDDGTCEFTPAEDCAYGCGGADVTSHTDALYDLTPGSPVKLAGYIRSDYQTVCDDAGNVCTGLPALTSDSGESVALSPLPSIRGGGDWSCSYDHYEPPVCEPLHYDGRYWVWGTTRDRYSSRYADRAEAPGAPIPANDMLDVWDYCLQTTETALVGQYSGTFTTSAYPDVSFDVVGEIAPSESGQLMLTLSEPSCPTCEQTAISYVLPQTVPVEAGDGWISFELQTPTICDALYPPPVVTLASHRNTLSGGYLAPLVGRSSASCSSGEISLTRLP